MVERYINDINKHGQNDAESLICAVAKPSWKKNVNGPDGEFSTRIDYAEFIKSSDGRQKNSIDVTYNLTATAGDKHGSSALTFEVINEDGPKICSERSA